MKDKGGQGVKSGGHDTVPQAFSLPRCTQNYKAASNQLLRLQSHVPSLTPRPVRFQLLVRTGAFSLPISPLPLGCLPSPTHTDRKGFRTGRLGFSSSPGGGSYLFPRAWVFLFVGVFSLSETRKLNLPNG